MSLPKQLAHVAMAQATYVIENLAGSRIPSAWRPCRTACLSPCPLFRAAFTPSRRFATVGITEARAGELGMKVRCGVYDMGENGKSIIAREEHGFIRLIFEAYSIPLWERR